MPLGHVSAEICYTLRSFWKGNFTFCALDVLLQMPLLFQTPVISHKKVKLLLPCSIFSVLLH